MDYLKKKKEFHESELRCGAYCTYNTLHCTKQYVVFYIVQNTYYTYDIEIQKLYSKKFTV